MNTDNHMLSELRRRGHRLTPQRRLVLEVLLQSDHHLSADEIAQAIVAHYPSIAIDPATIYRTLKWLRDAGLVSETKMAQSNLVYALLMHHQHHHLICEQCQGTIEADPSIFEPVQALLLERYGFHARMAHLSIFGLCASCSQEVGA